MGTWRLALESDHAAGAPIEFEVHAYIRTAGVPDRNDRGGAGAGRRVPRRVLQPRQQRESGQRTAAAEPGSLGAVVRIIGTADARVADRPAPDGQRRPRRATYSSSPVPTGRNLDPRGPDRLADPRVNLLPHVRHAPLGTELFGALSHRAARVRASEEVADAVEAPAGLTASAGDPRRDRSGARPAALVRPRRIGCRWWRTKAR